MPKEYNCECCNYNTLIKTQYERHLNTGKHQKLVNEITIKKVETSNDIKILTDLVKTLLENKNLQPPSPKKTLKNYTSNTNCFTTQEFMKQIKFKDHDIFKLLQEGQIYFADIIKREIDKLDKSQLPIICSDLRRGIFWFCIDEVEYEDGEPITDYNYETKKFEPVKIKKWIVNHSYHKDGNIKFFIEGIPHNLNKYFANEWQYNHSRDEYEYEELAQKFFNIEPEMFKHIIQKVKEACHINFGDEC